MNILITGGAGYIGTELIELLKANKAVKQIVVYDNLCRRNYNFFLGKSKFKTDKIRFVQGDILNSRKLKEEVDRANIVFHLAGKVITPLTDYNSHEFDQINNWGTAELTYLVEDSNVSKFIYTSSVSIYGASQKEKDIEGIPNPRTFYGISKLRGEKHVERLLKSDIQTYILRVGNVYGYSKSMRFNSVINKFMFKANYSNRINIYGDGSQMRSFIHIDQLSAILFKIGLTDDLKPNIYNLVGNTFTINEIVDELKILYPNLEMTYVNQNIKMRSLNIKPDKRISKLVPPRKNHLATDLKIFSEQFNF